MPRIKQFNQEEVLKKAMTLFWEKGYHNTSIQDLVTHVGLHRGSLYDTFGGKKELFKKVFKKYIEINNQVLSVFLDKEKSIKKGLIKFFELPIDASLCEKGNRGCLVVNTATEMLPVDNELHILLKNNRIELESIFVNYLKKGLEDGQISRNKNIHEIASFIYTLLNGVLVIGKINSDKKYLMNIVKTGLAVLD